MGTAGSPAGWPGPTAVVRRRCAAWPRSTAIRLASPGPTATARTTRRCSGWPATRSTSARSRWWRCPRDRAERRAASGDRGRRPAGRWDGRPAAHPHGDAAPAVGQEPARRGRAGGRRGADRARHLVAPHPRLRLVLRGVQRDLRAERPGRHRRRPPPPDQAQPPAGRRPHLRRDGAGRGGRAGSDRLRPRHRHDRVGLRRRARAVRRHHDRLQLLAEARRHPRPRHRRLGLPAAGHRWCRRRERGRVELVPHRHRLRLAVRRHRQAPRGAGGARAKRRPTCARRSTTTPCRSCAS